MTNLSGHLTDCPNIQRVDKSAHGRSGDRALRFYQEVLGLDRLHYGMWVEDAILTFENLFAKAAAVLKHQGYLMVCDYFTLDHTRGIMAKSGHNRDHFLRMAEKNHFALLQQLDITRDVMKTLRMAKYVAYKAILALDIGAVKIRTRHPLVTRLALRLFRKKLNRIKEEMQLIDADKFQQNKTYQFFLFQSQSADNGAR